MNDPRPVAARGGEPLDDRPLPLRLRAEDYELLAKSGAFEGYAHTELIDGTIVYMNAQHRPHWRTKMAIYDALRDALARSDAALTPFVEGTVLVHPSDMPEPDVALTSEPDGDGHVPVGSIALIVEVSDASLGFDLGKKRERYAVAGIPEYWVADLNGRILHQFWSPSRSAYQESRMVPFGRPVEAATIAGLAIPTDRLG